MATQSQQYLQYRTQYATYQQPILASETEDSPTSYYPLHAHFHQIYKEEK